MNIQLAIETSTDVCSVALKVNNDILTREELTPRKHAHVILPFIEELLSEAGHPVGDLDSLIISKGPGNFTGLRVGFGIAQGIAFAKDLPVYAVSSLAAFAQSAYAQTQKNRVAVLQDAKMQEVYAGFYHLDASGAMTPDSPDSLINPKDYALPNGDWLVVGNAWETYAALSQKAPLIQAMNHLSPRAKDLFALTQSTEPCNIETVLPVYLRTQSAWKKSVA